MSKPKIVNLFLRLVDTPPEEGFYFGEDIFPSLESKDDLDLIKEKLFTTNLRPKDKVLIHGNLTGNHLIVFLVIILELWRRFEDSIQTFVVEKDKETKIDYIFLTGLHNKKYSSSFLPLKQ